MPIQLEFIFTENLFLFYLIVFRESWQFCVPADNVPIATKIINVYLIPSLDIETIHGKGK